MKRAILIFVLFIYLLTYSNCTSLHGEIEQRFNLYYLVNKSKTESYKFTIKETKIQDEHLYSFSTQIIELSPGDEKCLGGKFLQTNVEYPIKEKQTLTTWTPFTKEELKKDKERIAKEKEDEKQGIHHRFVMPDSDIDEYLGFGLDTIINGQNLKYKYETEEYYDKSNPLPIKYFKYKYEVTGEILLKN